ncbi:MAG: hypothetical protein WC872_02605 [Candidatus Absconditabacterales bacterium]
MKKIGLIFGSFLVLSFINFTFAGGGMVTDSKIVAPERVPPIQNSISYIFDETGAKNLLANKSLLLQVNCNALPVLKSLGFTENTSKTFSLGLQEGDFDYNFDFRNCGLWANRTNANYNYTKSLTEKQALDFAEKFMQDSYLKDKVFYKTGKPIILSKNNNGPYYPIAKEGSIQSSDASDISGIEIDNSDPQTIEPEYTSFSILYPYVLNGQEIYEQYGNKAGITLEVSADGVMSLNARLLLFKGILRNSEKLSSDDLIRIIKMGGNSPFRGQTQQVKFNKPERILVLFNLRRDNKNYLYFSSGIGLKSNVKPDQYAQQNYNIILSDYKIGNITQ